MKTIAVYEENALVLDALCKLLSGWGLEIGFKAIDSKELLKKLKNIRVDLLLAHTSQPFAEQIQFLRCFKKKCESAKVLLLANSEQLCFFDQISVCDVDAVLQFNCNPKSLHQKILSLLEIKSLDQTFAKPKINLSFSSLKKRFIELACTDYSYAQIANLMCVSIRTVENYRDSVYEKLDVHSRNALIDNAIKFKIVSI